MGIYLSEDIGSCFESIRECQPYNEEGKIALKFSPLRRKIGIHHTPYDVTAHMFDIRREKTDFSDDKIRPDLVVTDLAVGAGRSGSGSKNPRKYERSERGLYKTTL